MESDVFGAWFDNPQSLVEEFRTADPFPHIVIENFLSDPIANSLLNEFPSIETMPHSRDYIFGNKHELSSVEEVGSAAASFACAITGQAFKRVLSDLTGRDVFVDERFHGGGFHQGGDGSFLDMHVDFNIHPLHSNWLRIINCLLYLNPDWAAEYGGQLLLKNHPDADPKVIAPAFNRAVIMITDERTFHGYRRMSLPVGVTRKSIATYAYAVFEIGSVRPRTTGWTPESPSLLKRAVASQYDLAVRLKNRVFGSSTASNR